MKKINTDKLTENLEQNIAIAKMNCNKFPKEGYYDGFHNALVFVYNGIMEKQGKSFEHKFVDYYGKIDKCEPVGYFDIKDTRLSWTIVLVGVAIINLLIVFMLAGIK
jgi:hypothetical protein